MDAARRAGPALKYVKLVKTSAGAACRRIRHASFFSAWVRWRHRGEPQLAHLLRRFRDRRRRLPLRLRRSPASCRTKHRVGAAQPHAEKGVFAGPGIFHCLAFPQRVPMHKAFWTTAAHKGACPSMKRAAACGTSNSWNISPVLAAPRAGCRQALSWSGLLVRRRARPAPFPSSSSPAMPCRHAVSSAPTSHGRHP